jgi:hypothetical protein
MLVEKSPRNQENTTPAIKYLNIVIPAKAGIQVVPGCRSKIPHSSGIKSGMTELVCLVARLITSRMKLQFAGFIPDSID